MGRVIGAVIGGYVVMFIWVFALSTAAWFGLGPSGAFLPGSWEPSVLWLAINIVVGLTGGIAGGYSCALIAKGDHRGPKGLIGLVVVLGILFAIPVIMGPAVEPGPRPDSLAMTDAMMKIRMPIWIALLNPVLGAVGVLLGAGFRRSSATH